MNKFVKIAALGALVLGSAGCVGVGVDGDVGYVGGYYEPYGYEYGGWGPGYGVGPYRGRGQDWHGGGAGPGRAFHAPAGGRGMPGIPSHPRGR